MMSNIAHQRECLLTGDHGLRHDNAEWAVLAIEMIAWRRLVGLTVPVHQHCAGAATDGA